MYPFSALYVSSQSIVCLDGSRVLNLGDEDVGGANGGKLIHSVGNVLAQHHGRDSNPAAFFQAVDGGCSLARGDLSSLLEAATLDVVCAEDVFLSGCRAMLAFLHPWRGHDLDERTDDTTDSGCDQVDEIGVGGVLGADQDGGGLEDSRDSNEACCTHCLAGLNKIDNTVCNAQSASGLYTATDVLDVGVELLSCLLALEFSEVDLCEVGETGADIFSYQRLCVLELSFLGDLDLKLATTKVKVKDFFDTGGLGWGLGNLVLGDLITAGDTKITTTLRDEGRDIRGGQEDEGDGEVLDEGNVETRVSVELNVGTVEKLDTCLVKTSLCGKN
jgi:hypothetical protein